MNMSALAEPAIRALATASAIPQPGFATATIPSFRIQKTVPYVLKEDLELTVQLLNHQ